LFDLARLRMTDSMTLEEVLAQDFDTLPEMIRMHAAHRPQHIALRQDARSLDYRGLEELVDRIAAAWVALDDSAAAKSFQKWLVASGTVPAAVVAEPDGPFNLIYSSGTTGTPKGIEQSNMMRWRQWQRAFAYDYKPDSVTLVPTPLYSNTTLVSFLPTLAVGATVVLMAKFDATKFLELAQNCRATVGVPSERWGETPVAFVVPRAGATATADALKDWANERLGKTQRIAAVEFTDTLPRSAIGKVLKRELRDAYNAKAPAVS
jgi:acyl-CoA synthetase (AMP-forming)/AMP-acid ligase II